MIHEEGVPVEEAEAYVEKWSLATPEQAQAQRATSSPIRPGART